MNRKIIGLIVTITTLSLLGIILTQILWLDRAIRLRTLQFNYMVHSSLTKIESELNIYKNQLLLKYKSDTSLKTLDSLSEKDFFKKVYCESIDTMMTNEFGCFEPHKDYIYAIIDSSTNEYICGNFTENNKHLIKNSKHKFSLSRMTEKNNFIIAVYFYNEKHLIVRKMFIWLLALSGVFLLVVIICFLFIIFSILKQKKISEMKNDFVNNMTHEFKTPISTISVAAEMLMKPEVCESQDKIRKYANIIYDENLRLRNQVEQVLQISTLDKNELKINPTTIDVHKIIENSVDIFNLIVKEKNGIITTELNATHSIIKADELHFINVITNMIDNAIKYCHASPHITITTYNKPEGICIRIKDNGIGISLHDQKHIFKKFFRVHTGNIHNVKGFGLGLYYVKSVVDAHHGYIELVKSELHKGSVFELFFPFNI